VVAKRSEVYWVSLDPAVGTEIRKTRPCVVVSPDELNSRLHHVTVAPLTGTIRPFQFRVITRVAGRPSSVVLDQLRTVDIARLGERAGKVDTRTMREILGKLQAMFAE
jgi:mRNA interferase MazF